MSRTKRVAVASPQTRLAMARRSGVRAQAPHLARADVERARRVHRAQLRTALVALALLTGLVVGLPLLLAALPGLSDLHLLGVRVSWLAVAVLPYAALVALAVGQLRRAERIEAPPPPPPSEHPPHRRVPRSVTASLAIGDGESRDRSRRAPADAADPT